MSVALGRLDPKRNGLVILPVQLLLESVGHEYVKCGTPREGHSAAALTAISNVGWRGGASGLRVCTITRKIAARERCTAFR